MAEKEIEIQLGKLFNKNERKQKNFTQRIKYILKLEKIKDKIQRKN